MLGSEARESMAERRERLQSPAVSLSSLQLAAPDALTPAQVGDCAVIAPRAFMHV